MITFKLDKEKILKQLSYNTAMALRKGKDPSLRPSVIGGSPAKWVNDEGEEKSGSCIGKTFYEGVKYYVMQHDDFCTTLVEPERAIFPKPERPSMTKREHEIEETLERRRRHGRT